MPKKSFRPCGSDKNTEEPYAAVIAEVKRHHARQTRAWKRHREELTQVIARAVEPLATRRDLALIEALRGLLRLD
jgi:adenosyl cobinamide kinase/adenosyl cobinamide phosphate guanylyltransferase